MVQLIGVDFEVFGRVQGKWILSFNKIMMILILDFLS